MDWIRLLSYKLRYQLSCMCSNRIFIMTFHFKYNFSPWKMLVFLTPEKDYHWNLNQKVGTKLFSTFCVQAFIYLLFLNSNVPLCCIRLFIVLKKFFLFNIQVKGKPEKVSLKYQEADFFSVDINFGPQLHRVWVCHPLLRPFCALKKKITSTTSIEEASF